MPWQPRQRNAVASLIIPDKIGDTEGARDDAAVARRNDVTREITYRIATWAGGAGTCKGIPARDNGA